MEKTPMESWILDKIALGLNERINENDNLREYIEKYQLKKLKETIAYVKENSAFYREHLEKIYPETINSFEEFKKVPFTNTQHIIESSLRFLCVSQQYISRITSISTSGTSGIAKRIYFSEEDQELTIDFFENGMSCLVNKENKVLILLPGHTPGSVGDLLKKGLSRMNVESYIYGAVKDYYEVEQIIKEKNIDSIVGIPIQVINLKRRYGEIFNKYIKNILLSTDYVPETLIRELSSEHCRVFTHYGMTEMCFGGGVECQSLSGYHMREADLYFEIINPKTGEVVKDGEYGEVVFTTLTRKAMPLIRYRTGDLARFKDKPCSCGTVLKTMERVLGRRENSINLFEDKFLSLRDLDEALLIRKDILNYTVSIVENREKHCDSIIIKLQLNEPISQNIKDYINIALNKIPIIYEALKMKKLELIVDTIEEEIITGNGTLKRKIKDYRERI